MWSKPGHEHTGFEVRDETAMTYSPSSPNFFTEDAAAQFMQQHQNSQQQQQQQPIGSNMHYNEEGKEDESVYTDASDMDKEN